MVAMVDDAGVKSNGISVKERYRLKLVEYISDPLNEFPDRTKMAVTVLGFRHAQSLYVHFSPQELAEIEDEGLNLRRARYAPRLSAADRGILLKAAKGDAAAAKLCYQRFEGWSEKSSIDVGVTVNDVLAAFPEPVQKQIREALAKKIG